MSARVAKTAGEVILDPLKGWERVELRSDWPWPLLALAFATAMAWTTYYANVDLAWLQDHLLAGHSELQGRELEFMRNLLGRTLLTVMSIASSLLVGGAFLLLTAAWLKVVARTRRSDPYVKWVGRAAWLTVPETVMLLMMALRCAIADTSNLPPELSNPLSIAQLTGIGVGSRWLSLAGSVGMQSLWTIALCAAGLRHWLGMGWVRALSIALAPALLLYGAWAMGIALGATQ
ncbi:hypothetical protein EDF77_3055 [Stenotrophomonas maltophilia]|uniref:YIP1 family protein n=1 Tax=Stenotrophomonas chelatiphaga TaxID=517011 RepID=UPI000F961E75|nr:YIP1 family protein [Stenotrophomonas chelatiphaga]MCS4229794.1 hypothetical protein [Stenotrophomonas chelatiphaga]ROQ37982.1 hypothetical protein EDF77_3055 [Stenotrophomonas maltophilia]